MIMYNRWRTILNRLINITKLHYNDVSLEPPYLSKKASFTWLIKISTSSHKYHLIAANMGYRSKQIIYLNSAKIGESTDIYFTLIKPLLKKLHIFFFIFPYISLLFSRKRFFIMYYFLFSFKWWRNYEYWYTINRVMRKSRIPAKNLWTDFSNFDLLYCH